MSGRCCNSRQRNYAHKINIMTFISIIHKLVSAEELPKNFLRFYGVGLLLFMIPQTRPLFVHITALSIMLVLIAVFYHHKRWDLRTICLFVLVTVCSFLIEERGVASGQLFGNYRYDSGLGIKLFHTPLIIGVNWLFLVYASSSIATRITNKALYKILLGAILMVAYDMVMELAAPPMNMWHFDSFYPPVENFVMWFVVSSLFHTLFVIFKIDTDNAPARVLFWIQILFFMVISLYSIVFIK